MTSPQRLLQIRDQVVRVFEAHGHADEAFGDAAAVRASGVIDAWLIVVGNEIRDSIPPTEIAISKSLVRTHTCSARARSPFTSKLKIAPNPDC